jgi:hypothetical protein
MDVFEFVAERLAREFEHVVYYNGMGDPFPRAPHHAAGEGVRQIDRVREEDFWREVPRSQCVMFPYLYTSGIQEYLRASGVPTWGSGAASWLELDRWRFHELQKELGMPHADAELVVGLDALEAIIREVDDCYIKVSYWRGDFETFHHQSAHITQAWIDCKRAEFGPLGASYEFVVEYPIPDAAEVGYDGYIVNGKWGALGAIGYEVKNAGYIGKVLPYDEVPEPIRYTLETLAPFFGDTATNYSNEIRVTSDGTPYLIDPCMRCGSPPTECLFEAFENWGEIILAGSHGQHVMPRPTCRYFAQIQVHSQWIKDRWMPIEYPKSLEKWVKCYSKVEVDGKFYIPPARDSTDICAVTAVGDTLEATVEQCLRRMEQFKGLDLEKKDEVFNDIFDTIQKGEEYGIDW